MLVLDENVPADQRRLLRKWRVHFRVVGVDVASWGTTDENLIPAFHGLAHPTLYSAWIADCVTQRTVGWATFRSPSPRPSPLGRGRIVHRLSTIRPTEFAKPVCAKHAPGGGCPLSPRERVRVRGNDGSTARCRLSQGLPCKLLTGSVSRIGSKSGHT